MSMKNSNDTIGIRTHDLLACSAVLQPTAPPCTPRYTYYISNLFMFQYNYHHYKDLFLRSDVPTATLLKIRISWDVTLSCCVGTEQVMQNHTVFICRVKKSKKKSHRENGVTWVQMLRRANCICECKPTNKKILYKNSVCRWL